jgi:2-isopropylmalate synthase
MENRGYQFEGAEASFELLMKRAMGTHRKFFSVVGFRVMDEKRHEDQKPISEATVKVRVGGKMEHTAAEGNGPVNALDNALRKALEKFYPRLKELKLLDYKVRVLPAGQGTASAIRVLIESGDKDARWGTVGVSDNIIEASYQALLDSVEYKLDRDGEVK